MARLQLIQPAQDLELACGIQVFSESDRTYIITNTLPAYEILEIFKGPSIPTTIPVVWFTDTGFRTEIPSFLSDDSGGFLAFLGAQRNCQNETSFWMLGDDEEPIPYEMSECSYHNMPWSSVDDDDVEWLRQQTDDITLAPSTTYSIGLMPTVAPAPTTIANIAGEYTRKCVCMNMLYATRFLNNIPSLFKHYLISQMLLLFQLSMRKCLPRFLPCLIRPFQLWILKIPILTLKQQVGVLVLLTLSWVLWSS